MLGLSRPRCLDRARTPAAEHVVLAWKIRVQQWLGQSASRMRPAMYAAVSRSDSGVSVLRSVKRCFRWRRSGRLSRPRSCGWLARPRGSSLSVSNSRFASRRISSSSRGALCRIDHQHGQTTLPRLAPSTSSIPASSRAVDRAVAGPSPNCAARNSTNSARVNVGCFRYVGGKHIAAKNGCDVCDGDKLVVAEPATADLRGDVDLIV